MPITEEDIENWFTHHPPTPEQVKKYLRLRDEAKSLALTFLDVVPASADQSAAIRLLREAVMTANAGIACNTPGA